MATTTTNKAKNMTELLEKKGLDTVLEALDLEIPAEVYGKYVPTKKKLVLRTDLPVGAKTFRALTDAEVDAVYETVIRENDKREGTDYLYILRNLHDEKAARMGHKSHAREAVRKAAGL